MFVGGDARERSKGGGNERTSARGAGSVGRRDDDGTRGGFENSKREGDVRREGTREDDDGEAAHWEGEANGERDESRGAGREERERVQHVANDIFERFLREVSRDADFVRDVEQTKHEEKSARGNRKVARSVGGARE